MVTEETSSNTVHNSAYAVVKEFVKTKVIEEHNIVPLTALHDTYIAELNEQGVQNVSYRTQKLKSRLEHDDDLKEHIHFSKVYLKNHDSLSFWLIYSSHTITSDAIVCAYKLGTADHLKDSSLYL